MPITKGKELALLARGFNALFSSTLEIEAPSSKADHVKRLSILKPLYGEALLKICQGHNLDSLEGQDDYQNLHAEIVEATLEALFASRQANSEAGHFPPGHLGLIRIRAAAFWSDFLEKLRESQTTAHALKQKKKQDEAKAKAMANQTMTDGEIEHGDQPQVAGTADTASALNTDATYHDGFVSGFSSGYHVFNDQSAYDRGYADCLAATQAAAQAAGPVSTSSPAITSRPSASRPSTSRPSAFRRAASRAISRSTGPSPAAASLSAHHASGLDYSANYGIGSGHVNNLAHQRPLPPAPARRQDLPPPPPPYRAPTASRPPPHATPLNSASEEDEYMLDASGDDETDAGRSFRLEALTNRTSSRAGADYINCPDCGQPISKAALPQHQAQHDAIRRQEIYYCFFEGCTYQHLGRPDTLQDHLNKEHFYYLSKNDTITTAAQHRAAGTRVPRGTKAPGQGKLNYEHKHIKRSPNPVLKQHAKDNRAALATYRDRIETLRAHLSQLDPDDYQIVAGIAEDVAAVIDDSTDIDTMSRAVLIPVVSDQRQALQRDWRSEYETLVAQVHSEEVALGVDQTEFEEWEDLD